MSYSFTKTSEEGWLSIVQDIKNAKHSIDVELYILDIDSVGMYLLDALERKSLEGVKVRILADAVGSYQFYLASTLKAKLRANGIKISFFNHFIPWYPQNLKTWYFRNHRRSVTIDSAISYTGGICFSSHMEKWRETMIRITKTETILDISHAFERMWDLAEYRRFDKRIKPKRSDWLYLTSAPLPGKYYYYKEIMALIKNCKKEIFLTTPYFVPDYLFYRALYRAQKRGVTIHLLIPHHSNHRFVDHAGDFFKERLIKKGALLYRYTKAMIHSKTIVFDDVACTVGSMNLDNVSLRYNFESGLIIHDQECIQDLKMHFIEDTRGLKPLTLKEWHARPLKEKILMYLTWPIQKFL